MSHEHELKNVFERTGKVCIIVGTVAFMSFAVRSIIDSDTAARAESKENAKVTARHEALKKLYPPHK